jgi:hypothetical protein
LCALPNSRSAVPFRSFSKPKTVSGWVSQVETIFLRFANSRFIQLLLGGSLLELSVRKLEFFSVLNPISSATLPEVLDGANI